MTYISERKDIIVLGLSGVVTLISGLVVGDIITSAFGGQSGLQESFRSLILIMPLIDLVNVVSVMIGVYLGLLTLLCLDDKKRIQALFLLIATLFAAVVLWFGNVMLTAMGPLDFLIVLLSLYITAMLVGGTKIKQLSIGTDTILGGGFLSPGKNRPVEFKSAASLLWLLLLIFIIISFHEAYTSYPQFLIDVGGSFEYNPNFISEYQSDVESESTAAFNILIAIVFLGSFRYFLQYDTGKKIFVIGPKSAGKSHLLVGLFATAEQQGFVFNPREQSSDYLSAKRNQLERSGWIAATEEEIHDMGFTFTSSGLLRRNIEVAGLDYPGEYSYYLHQGLELINDGLEVPNEPIFERAPVQIGGDELIGEQISELDKGTRSRWAHLENNAANDMEQRYIQAMQRNEFDPANRTTPGLEEAYMHLVNTVLPIIDDADTLIFVFDCKYHMKEQSGEKESAFEEDQSLAFYSRILTTADADQTIGVATKAGYLIQAYEDEQRRQFRYGDEQSYELFRQWTNNELRSGTFRRDINTLQVNLIPTNIKENDSGDPELNQTFGIKKLLDELG